LNHSQQGKVIHVTSFVECNDQQEAAHQFTLVRHNQINSVRFVKRFLLQTVPTVGQPCKTGEFLTTAVSPLSDEWRWKSRVTWKRKPLHVISKKPTLKLQWCNTQINDG